MIIRSELSVIEADYPIYINKLGIKKHINIPRSSVTASCAGLCDAVSIIASGVHLAKNLDLRSASAAASNPKYQPDSPMDLCDNPNDARSHAWLARLLFVLAIGA